ncbi:hypothetical protein EJV44_23245 [Ancylobacter aquaticus]|nr:hypothetical protein EJV44_23245 [Ancylobacter aquaticus]
MRARRDAAPGLANRQSAEGQNPQWLHRNMSKSHGSNLKPLDSNDFLSFSSPLDCLTLEEVKNSL